MSNLGMIKVQKYQKWTKMKPRGGGGQKYKILDKMA